MTWLPKPCDAEWSVIAMYSRPQLARRARHLARCVLRPSEAVVCMCRSPWRSDCSSSAGTSPGPSFELAAVLAQLGRDPRQPEALVDLLLGRAAQRLAGRVVEDPVLGDVQPAAHGRLAQRHVVGLRAGEVLQQVAELVGLDDAQVDVEARVRARRGRRCRRARRPLDHVELGEGRQQRRGIAGGGDDVEVLDGVGQAARAAGQLDAPRRGVRAQRARRSPRRSPARGGSSARGLGFSATPAANDASTGSSNFAPKPRTSRSFWLSAAARSASSESIPSSS